MLDVRLAGEGARCPDCSQPLSQEPWATGLCLSCLVGLAVSEVAVGVAPTVDPGALPTEAPSAGTFAAGQILGNRYRVRSLLGRGGMGEVWRALDLKLRVDVALKALRASLLAEEHSLETLRQEVRAAREVVSPNVCRVFDLVELDGRELVSMEYVDGTSLQEVLAVRSPLAADEAREIASQLLAGLEAIHAASLVHRDIKPENVMLTRAGRVVVMDFGIAKALAADRRGTVAGTPAYMAPEQARGEALDARADVFSAGIVLAEMLAPDGIRSRAAREAVWAGVHRSPPELAETPWAPVLRKAVAPRREDRYPSASALARALEEVTLRVAGAELLEPYPGLASFSAADAEYFFGRELEIEAMWRKLRQPHLLALVGPSGAGKSSFLRAGLLATAPAGWRSLVATPGDRPFKALAQVLIPELSGDPEGVELLLRIEEPDAAVAAFTRWRRRHEHALLVVDQFEELFTQNPPAVEAAFAALIGRLALDADVHVLVSMRDDFLFRCHAHEALQPILSELTLLGPPTGAALRRALVQPALKCGYRFEDESLVDAMLAEVEGERGALPLLAFAAAQLWQRRDRERGMLTREAYEAIGGVAGALAQHAEATLERIGQERVAIVRELFRNLVTAQGTRATVDREELLSVFAGSGAAPGRDTAAVVLDALIDARLLTSYELPAAEGETTGQHRVEIVHESLLSQWPRLVHWQAQDQEGALLRDQLRQAARLWEQRGQPEDLLWTGTSLKEYELWRERYAGSLTASEESFARAMTSRAARRRRRRRLAVAAVVVLALAVTSAMSVLWLRSEGARLRAEASKLVALGQAELERFPTAALAYAAKSLEVADTREGRLMVLRALELGPPARFLLSEPGGLKPTKLAFSPAGDWLAIGGIAACELRPRNGGPAVVLPHAERAWVSVGFDPAGDRLVTSVAGNVRAWSVQGARELWRRRAGETTQSGVLVRGAQFFTETLTEDEIELRRWSFDGTSALVGGFDTEWGSDIDPTARWLAYTRGRQVLVRSIDDWSSAPITIGEHAALVRGVSFHPGGEHVAAADAGGEIRIWPTAAAGGAPLRILPSAGRDLLAHDPQGRWLAAYGFDIGLGMRLWDLEGPPAAEPMRLEQTASDLAVGTFELAFDPRREWMASAAAEHIALWPVARQRGWILGNRNARVNDLAFTADSRALLSADEEGSLRLWPLEPGSGEESRLLLRNNSGWIRVVAGPAGNLVAAAGYDGDWVLVPLDRTPPQHLEGYSELTNLGALALSPSGRRMAVGPTSGSRDEQVIRVWDLDSESVRILGPLPGAEQLTEGAVGGLSDLHFLDEDRLLSSHPHGVRSWNLSDGSFVNLFEEPLGRFALARGGRTLLANRVTRPVRAMQGRSTGDLVQADLGGGPARRVVSHGPAVAAVALDPTGNIVVTGSADGLVRVGPVSGQEPQIVGSHEGSVLAVAVSPDGRWIASGGADRKIHLWRMPDLSRPPLHTLPRRALLAWLHSATNLRVVEDKGAPTGWKVEIGPFPGWEEAPSW